MTSQLRKASLLCLIIVNVCQADELDYLLGSSQSSSSDANILFILDGSDSLHSNYNYTSSTNPATNFSDPDAKNVRDVMSAFRGQLQNTHIIPPSATIATSEHFCQSGGIKHSEGVVECPESVSEQRWFPRKLDLIRDIIRDLLPELKGTNVGFMRTAKNHQSFNEWLATGSNPNTVERDLQDPNYAGDNGGYVISAFKKIQTNSDALDIANRLTQTYRALNSFPEAQQSPLAESLVESYKYFGGWDSHNVKSISTGWDQIYLDTIDRSAYQNNVLNGMYNETWDECTDNHVVMVTDGAPTYDWQENGFISNKTGATITRPAPSGDDTQDTLPEHTLLDEFAGFLAQNDHSSKIPGQQHITTHFVSTWSTSESTAILDTAAAASGGFHIPVTDIAHLHDAMKNFLTQLKGNQKPIIGYKVLATTSSNNPLAPKNEAYVNTWERSNGRWLGNLKKFKINDEGKLIDDTNIPFVAHNHSINPDVRDLWSTTPNGVNTLAGGAASKLSEVGQNRYILTGPTTQKNISIIQKKYKLTPSNTQITANMINASSTQQRIDILNWASGMDINDIDNDGNTTEVRQSLGDQINAAPAIARYGNGTNSNPVIFTGSNEGYLHAINAADGQHLYSFMPRHFLKKLDTMHGLTTPKTYGIDGDIKVWHDDRNNDFNLRKTNSSSPDENEKLMLFFGLRRGGRAFYALDISQRTQPKVAWIVDHQHTGFNRLGQTWNKPAIARISADRKTIDVVTILSAGFDPGLEDNTQQTPNIGNAIYVLDTYTGRKKWTISSTKADIIIPEMTNSIISSPALIDFNRDGFTDAFFVNDIRGQIFRCDFIADDARQDLQCGIIAQAQASATQLLFMGSIDASFIKNLGTTTTPKLALSLTSGNRLDPLNNTETNQIVTFFDTNTHSTPKDYGYNNGLIITHNDLLNARATAQELNDQTYGWYFTFSSTGEKSFSQTLIFDNKIFFSTHKPSSPASGACDSGRIGLAKVYGLNISNGNHIANISQANGDNKGIIWTGQARGLPDTPYIVSKIVDKGMEASLNLGVDQTNMKTLINPVSRSYWYQK